jgi:hypothetical protein
MGKYDWIDTPIFYAYFDDVRDPHQLARGCQVLLELVGLQPDQQAAPLWTTKGPTRRASWMKGYIRRAPVAGTRPKISPISSLSHAERTMLLVAFDFWNGSGEAYFRDVLNMGPRLATAISGLVEASCADPGVVDDSIARWIARWSRL